MPTPKIINFTDYSLEEVRAQGPVRPPPPGRISFVHHCGFDPETRFQRMGVGTQKMFTVQHGGTALTGMSFEIQPPGFCRIVEQDMSLYHTPTQSGRVTIEAVASGDCELRLVSGGTKVDSISIKAAPSRNVITRFYNLIDGTGRQGVDPSRIQVLNDALPTLIERVKGIVHAQCGVLMVRSGTGLLRDLNTSEDLQARVNIDRFNIYALSGKDDQAQYHVMYVWGIDGAHSNGITRLNMTMINNALTNQYPEVTLAHEFVHFLSGSGIRRVDDHDPRREDLMFKTAPHGINMRKDRLLRIIS
jgi:hypothetical protein